MSLCVESVIMSQRKNRYRVLYWILVCTVTFSTFAYPQSNIPIGTWRNHLAYNKARIVHQVEDNIFCVTENGLFIYRTDDNSIQLLSKIDGLNDIIISAINYQIETGSLVLGYTSGNVDLIKDQEILNIPDIRDANLS